MKKIWKTEGVRKQWDRYKYAALVVLVGAGLLLWPSGKRDTGTSSVAAAAEETTAETIQAEMEEILGQISGVGQVRVMLTADTDGDAAAGRDTELTYRGEPTAPEDYSARSRDRFDRQRGGDAPVVTQRVYPTYRGALVVCQGGDQPQVRLAVTEAVSALTGLSADRIAVAKWQ